MPSKSTSFLKAFVGSLAIIVLVLLFLPTFISTSAGKKALIAIISKKSGCRLEIADLSLSWLSGQQAKGVQLEHSSDALLFSCQEIATDAGLIDLLFKRDLGNLSLNEPDLNLSRPYPPSFQAKAPSFKRAGFSGVDLTQLPSSLLAMLVSKLPFTGTILIEKGKARFHPPGLEVIGFDQIGIALQMQGGGDISLKVNCATNQDQVQGQIAIDSSATQWGTDQPQLRIQTHLSQLPVMGIDQLVGLFFPKISGWIYAAVGKSVNMQCDLTSVRNNFDVNLNMDSPQIKVALAAQTADGTVSLKSPGTIRIQCSPALLKGLGLKLPQASDFEIAIAQFACPVPKSPADLQQAAFQATITTSSSLQWPPLVLNQLKLSANSPHLKEHIAFTLSANAQTQAHSLPFAVEGSISYPFSMEPSVAIRAPQFPVDLLNAFVDSPVALSTMLGKTADVTGFMQMDKEYPLLRLSWSSPWLNIPSFEISLASPAKLLSPAKLTWDITPILDLSKHFQSLKLSPIEGTLQTFDGNSIQAQLAIARATVGSSAEQIAVENISLPFQWDHQTQSGSVNGSLSVKNPSGGLGSVRGQIAVSHFFSPAQADILASIEVQDLSPLLIDALNAKAIFSALMGSTCSGKIRLQSLKDKGQVAIQWISPYLNVDSAFAISPSSIQLMGSNNQMQWTLTPESYALLDGAITGSAKGNSPFDLKDKTTFSIALNKLFLPLDLKTKTGSILDRIPNLTFDFSKLSLSATGNNPLLSFLNTRSKETIQLSNLSFKIDQSQAAAPLIASLEGNVITQQAVSAQGVKNGSFSILAELKNRQKTFDLSLLTGRVQLKAVQLPSAALDIAARAGGRKDSPFTTLFGEVINASFKADLNDFAGPVSLNLNTPLSRLSVSGHLAEGALLLNEPLFAQVKVTPGLSRLVLQEVNPLNLSSIESQAPVTLEIQPEEFYLPLYPFTVGKMGIGKGRIELGKISCRNEGNVNIALSLLKTKQFDKKGDLLLWFAPIDLSVKQGVAAIERTEILLADTFDICVWGKFDLVADYVDMVLGLTAQTLQKAFGIKNLPESYVLTIPMKGPANNVQINSGKATSKVALLLAWQNQNIAGAIGGPAGAIVGDVLGRIATLPDSNAKVPPAKHPFPWEVGKKSKTSQAPALKKRKFKANEKPLKQIFKLIK